MPARAPWNVTWKIWLLAPLLAWAVTATLAAARLIGAVAVQREGAGPDGRRTAVGDRRGEHEVAGAGVGRRAGDHGLARQRQPRCAGEVAVERRSVVH